MCGLGPRARRFLNLLCSFKHELGASGTRELPSTHPSALASARLGFELRGLARTSCKAWREASSLDRDSWARLITVSSIASKSLNKHPEGINNTGSATATVDCFRSEKKPWHFSYCQAAPESKQEI